MPSELKDFIKKQLKAEPENPGRFFTKYHGNFKVGERDLSYKLSFLVNGIGDDMPQVSTVKTFFKIIKKALKTICKEIAEEDPSIVISHAQIADMMTSLLFKMASYNFVKSLEDKDTPLIEHQTINAKSKIFINIAQKFYADKHAELEELIDTFYLAEFNKVFDYLRSVYEQIDVQEILTERDLVEKLNLESYVNYRTLPIIYQQKVILDLWNLHLAAKAKENPYPITVESLEYVIRNQAKFQRGVEATLLREDHTLGHVDYAPGFEQGNRFHDIIETELVDRLVLFARMYFTMLSQKPSLQEEGCLTAEGIKERDTILNAINAQKPLSPKLVKFMKAFETMNFQLKNIDEQLQQGSLFAIGSEEHNALQSFYEKISTALSSLKSAEPIKFPDGILRPYKLSDFRNACDIAFKEAEESILIHHPGWWANVFKPILIAIGICCTVGLALLSETVRNYAYAGFFNISKETEGMKHVTAVQASLDDTNDETYEDLKINYGIYAK